MHVLKIHSFQLTCEEMPQELGHCELYNSHFVEIYNLHI